MKGRIIHLYTLKPQAPLVWKRNRKWSTWSSHKLYKLLYLLPHKEKEKFKVNKEFIGYYRFQNCINFVIKDTYKDPCILLLAYFGADKRCQSPNVGHPTSGQAQSASVHVDWRGLVASWLSWWRKQPRITSEFYHSQVMKYGSSRGLCVNLYHG